MKRRTSRRLNQEMMRLRNQSLAYFYLVVDGFLSGSFTFNGATVSSFLIARATGDDELASKHLCAKSCINVRMVSVDLLFVYSLFTKI